MRRYEELKDVDLGKATLVRETERAVLVRIDKSKKELWIPKTVLSDDSEVYGKDAGPDGTVGRCIVAEWWAEKEGLV
jgi:hypothetical protein